jgi:putative transposase
MGGVLYLRGRFRLFNVKDDFKKDSVAIEANTSPHMQRLLHMLEQFKAERELPNMMRMDYGPEFLVRFSWTGARSTGCS